MKMEQVIDVNEIKIGTILLLKNGKRVKIKGWCNSMFPTINKVYSFKTDEGDIKPEEVERILL